MKKISTLLLIIFLDSTLMAQLPKDKQQIITTGKKNSIAGGLNIPLGIFSRSHGVGFAIQYSRSAGRFGLLSKKTQKAIGLTAHAGAAYYLGKKEEVVSYSYTYPGYLFFHIDGGAIYNVEKNGNISLTAGPGLSIYNSLARFNLVFRLSGNYYFNEKFGISTSFSGMKEKISDPLWAGSLKWVYIF